jgi:dTMP kinase
MVTREPASGVFVVFEGGEGSGKSTQVALLEQRLSASGREVVATREPGGSPLSEQIRELVLQDQSVDMSARCESLLFAAARAEHVASLIRPALARGAVVVCDRFAGSSIAYQGAGRGLGAQRVALISDWAADGLTPDLTIVLDIAPEDGLARAKDPNRLENETLEFHRLVLVKTSNLMLVALPGKVDGL